jgi:hypothetical protein
VETLSKATNTGGGDSRQRWWAIAITAVILFGHLNAFFLFGATFWADSLFYVGLGDALFDAEKLKNFYDGIGTWTFSHLGPGMPFVWAILKLSPVLWRWPLLAAVQHLLAVASCWLAFVWATRPSAISFCGAALLSVLPFYQSFQQMLMTESLSASLLLTVIACAIRLTTKGWSNGLFGLILAATFVVTQFRSYFGLMTAIIAMAVVFTSERRRFQRIAAVAAVFVTASLAFPVYRSFCTGKFFPASLGTNTLMFALWANPEPSINLISSFEQADLPADYSAAVVLQKGLDYGGIHRIDEYWRAQGLTDAEIKARANHLANLLLFDGPRPIVNRVLWGMNCCGFVLPYRLGPANYPVIRGATMATEWTNQMTHYRWLSWTDSSAAYQTLYEYCFKGTPLPHIPASAQSQKEIVLTLGPYLNFSATYMRDPLLLSWIPVDAWFFVGTSGIFLLCVYGNPKVGILLVIPVVVNFAVLACVVPGVRYAYPLIAVYLLAGVLGLETLLNRRKRLS